MKRSLKGDENVGSCRHKLFNSEHKLNMGLSPQVRILLDSLEMDSPMGREDFDRVLRALRSKVDPSHKSDQFEERAVQLYLPVYFWCRSKLKDHESDYPMFIGLNGPQGIGKSTLTEALCQCFEIDGEKAISLSIDDFYLRRDQQVALAREYKENPYLQMRGYPGTHDIELGLQVLSDLKGLGKAGTVQIPRYDKSAYQGLGDRRPTSEWPKVTGPLNIVFLEGWMLGFRPLASSQISEVHMRAINGFLPKYEVWYKILDSFIQLTPKSLDFISNWRIRAEEAMVAMGREGMSAELIRTYVGLFRPAYEIYLESLRMFPVCPNSLLHIEIGLNQLPY